MTGLSEADPPPVHASCVALKGRAVLLMGPSGSGKSSFALRLLALGADLVADDRVCLTPRDGRLLARAPDPLRGLIEARFLGLLSVPAVGEASVDLVVDLGRVETERLPPARKIMLAGIECPLVYGSATDHLSHAVLCWLKHGRFA